MANPRVNPTGQTPLLLSVTATHPDGLTWASAQTEGLRYRDIVDQVRNFVGPTKSPGSDRPLAGIPIPDESFAIFQPGDDPIGDQDGQVAGSEMQEWLNQLGT